MTTTTKHEWWQTVLGEYPTGVALVTSRGADGQNVGMVIGTFTAVSQDPPMVGFLPAKSSSTFPHIRANGTFSVSVLGTEHEKLARAFATKQSDKWEHGTWETSSAGNVRLLDALVWFDARLHSETEAGDHYIAIADVDDFGIGSADTGLPMLFLGGGYGTFAVDVPSGRPGHVHSQLRAAQTARPAIQSLAADLGAEVIVSAVDHARVIVLDSTEGRPLGTRSGPETQVASEASGIRSPFQPNHPTHVTFPLAAPLAPAFVAWSSAERRNAWTELSRHLLGKVNRPQLESLLDLTRERGWAVSGGNDLETAFFATTARESVSGELKQLWRLIERRTSDMLADPQRLPKDITSVQAPVFDANGEVSIVLTINRPIAPCDLEAVTGRLLDTTRQLSAEQTDELHNAS